MLFAMPVVKERKLKATSLQVQFLHTLLRLLCMTARLCRQVLHIISVTDLQRHSGIEYTDKEK